MKSMTDEESDILCLGLENSSRSSPPPRPRKHTNVSDKFRRNGIELPPCTSRWNNISYIESIGIYYNRSASTITEILDMVYRETGMFGHLSPEQRKQVQKLQDQVTFSFSIHDLYKFEPSDCLENTKKCLMRYQEEIKKQVTRRDKDKSEQSSAEGGKIDWPDLQKMFLVQDFIENIVLMLHYTDKRDVVEEYVSEAMFVDLFKSFVKMSGLIPSTGAEWKSSTRILQHQISSEVDVVILVREVLGCNPYSTAVSVVEIQNMSGSRNEKEIDSPHMKTRPQRRISSEDSDTSDLDSSKASNCDKSNTSNADYFEQQVHKQSDVYKYVAKEVLAQHGGELLLHANAYGRKFRCLKKEGCRLHPGMIVIGTQVIFTLLEYSTSHFRELKSSEYFEKEKGYIYYSQPKDFLKKEDRDELLESFARLRNIKSGRPTF